MTSTLNMAHSGESCIDRISNFSKLVRDAENELSSLQIVLGKAKALGDTNRLCTSLDNIRDGGSANDLIVQLLLGLAVLRGRLYEILYNSSS